jgi:hypothetical protein
MLYDVHVHLCVFMLGQANKSHPAKYDLIWAVGGGWAVSLAEY